MKSNAVKDHKSKMFLLTLTKTLLVGEFQVATNLVASTHCSFKSHWETYHTEKDKVMHIPVPLENLSLHQ